MQGRDRRVLYRRNDPVQRGAAEITEHITDIGAERTDEGASQAAAAEEPSADVLLRRAAGMASRIDVEDDNPARAIASFARQHQITQIVISFRRQMWMSHFLFTGQCDD
jgi:hypothetical protein